MKRILINATQEEELRVATVDGQTLIDLDIETSSAGRKKGNIYKGVITRIEQGLDAVFVDYGDPKHGFLPFREISQDYFKNKASGRRHSSRAIAESLRQGQALLVQVQREGHGGKGAALTTFLSLAGRYLVLMPNSPRAGGVSRRMGDRERDATRQALSQLEVREAEGVIVRTKGAGRDAKLLQSDLEYLRKLWDSIVLSAKSHPSAPFLVYEESNVVICALRDHFDDDIEEVMVDDPEVFTSARDFINLVMPKHVKKIKMYRELVPLFNRYHVEAQIETAFDREVTLPSGGSVVFDRTEALLSIDINSGKATRGSNIEETALNTNLEAAEEIARQLRLRDLGGLIVIDFIDMQSLANRKAVEARLYQATRQDQARVQFERISRFGLLEMSRQRLRPSLSESSHVVCPRCSGIGAIRTPESIALATLRMMEDEAIKEKSGRVVAQLPLEITSFLLNEKREKINEIEARHGVQLMVVPDPQMQVPHFQIRRYRSDDAESRNKYSYEMVTERKPALLRSHEKTGGAREKPAVNPVVDFMGKEKPAGKNGRIRTLFSSLFRKKQPPEKTESETREAEPDGRRHGGRRRSRSQSRRSDSVQRRNDRSSGSQDSQEARRNGRRRGEERGQRDNSRRGSARRGRGRQSSPPKSRPPTPSPSPMPTEDKPGGLAETAANRAPETSRRKSDGRRQSRQPGRAAGAPSGAPAPGGRTMFTPPMPTLPTDPPPAPHAGHPPADGGVNDARDENRSFRPATAPTPEAKTDGAVDEKKKAADGGPAPHPPMRFAKPKNLVQVETKSSPSDRG